MSAITPNDFTRGSVHRRNLIVFGDGPAGPDPLSRMPAPIAETWS